MSHMHMRHHSLFLFLLSSAIMNLTLFIFAIMKFYLIHFSQRSSSAQPFNLFKYLYIAICSNCISSFLICSIWMFHHSPYYCLWSNSNWRYWISLFSMHSLMVTLYLLSFKYFKLNISNMDYNTVTEHNKIDWWPKHLVIYTLYWENSQNVVTWRIWLFQ